MNRGCLGDVVIALPLLLACAASAQNLLYDPSFEAPSTWTTSAPPGSTWFIERTFASTSWFAHDGSLSLANYPHWGDEAIASQTVPLGPAQGTNWFIFSAYICGFRDFNCGDGIFELMIDFLDAGRQSISHHTTNVHAGILAQLCLWNRQACVARSTNGAAASVKVTVDCHPTAMGYKRDNRLVVDAAELRSFPAVPQQLSFDCPTQIYFGFTNWIGVALAHTSDVPVFVTFSNSRPGEVSMPENAVIPAGTISVDIPVECYAATGKVYLYASADDGTETSIERFLREASFAIDGLNGEYCRNPEVWFVNRDGPAREELTATLEGPRPITDLPGTIFFPYGVTSATFTCQAFYPTSATFRALAPGYRTGEIGVSFSAPIRLLHFNPIGAGVVFRPWAARVGPSIPSTVEVLMSGAVPPFATNIDYGYTTRYVPLTLMPTGTGTIAVSLSMFGLTNFVTNIVVSENMILDAGFEDLVDPTAHNYYRPYPWTFRNVSCEEGAAHSGAHGLQFYSSTTGDYARATDTIDLCVPASNAFYQLSLHARADAHFDSSTRSVAATVYALNGTTEVAVVSEPLYEKLTAQPGTWIHDEALLSIAPEHTSLVLELCATNNNPRGPFAGLMWDDLSLTPCPANTNALILLGSDEQLPGTTQTWQVVRLGSIENAVTVQTSSDQPAAAVVPASIEFLADARTMPMSIVVPDDVLAVGETARVVTITAEAPSCAPAERALTMRPPACSIMGPTNLACGYPRNYQLVASQAQDAPQVFELQLEGSVLQGPGHVSIPAGANWTLFALTATNSGMAHVTAVPSNGLSASMSIRTMDFTPIAKIAPYGMRVDVYYHIYGNFSYAMEGAYTLSGPWHTIDTRGGSVQYDWHPYPLLSDTVRFYRVWAHMAIPSESLPGYTPDIQ